MCEGATYYLTYEKYTLHSLNSLTLKKSIFYKKQWLRKFGEFCCKKGGQNSPNIEDGKYVYEIHTTTMNYILYELHNNTNKTQILSRPWHLKKLWKIKLRCLKVVEVHSIPDVLKPKITYTYLLYLLTKDHFYKVDVEKLNKPKICRILPYLTAETNKAEFCKFAVYSIFPHQPYKKFANTCLL